MSKRLTHTEPNLSKKILPRPSYLNPTQNFRFNSRETSRPKLNDTQPISHAAKRNAYDRIKKIQTLQKQKGSYCSFEQLMREVRSILKEDIDIPSLGIFPGEPKNETGKAILSDGTFFIPFSKIVFRCQYAMKKAYLQKLRDKFLPNVRENKTIFMLFLQDEEQKTEKAQAQKRKEWLQKQTQKIKENLKKQLQPSEKPRIAQVEEKIQYPQLEEPNQPANENFEDWRTFQDEAVNTSLQKEHLIRKPCIKPSSIQSQRKSVRWSQIVDSGDSNYLNQIVQANKQYISQQKKQDQEKQKKQKITQIRKSQSFLIDFFEINDIYHISMVDVVGILDQIDDKYVILLIKQKCQTPPPSFVKTRNSKMQEKQHKMEEKQKRQVLAIGLLKKIDVRGHQINQLKNIQCKYQDIWAYVEIDEPESLFLSSLPEESISDIESFKKQKKK